MVQNRYVCNGQIPPFGSPIKSQWNFWGRFSSELHYSFWALAETGITNQIHHWISYSKGARGKLDPKPVGNLLIRPLPLDMYSPLGSVLKAYIFICRWIFVGSMFSLLCFAPKNSKLSYLLKPLKRRKVEDFVEAEMQIFVESNLTEQTTLQNDKEVMEKQSEDEAAELKEGAIKRYLLCRVKNGDVITRS